MEAFLTQYGEDVIANLHHALIGWKSHPGTYRISFEEGLGDYGVECQVSAIKKMLTHVGLAITECEAQRFISNAVGIETKTYSGARSTLEDSWSDECERLFEHFGGPCVNQSLGYTFEWSPMG
jgi:hypothetical protein